MEISSRFDGTISKLYGEVGDMVSVGSTLVDIETEEDDDPQAGPEAPPETPVTPVQPPSILTTPAVRRLSRDSNVDLSVVAGSGKDGRILKEDVLAYIKQRPQPSNSTVFTPPATSTSNDVQQQEGEVPFTSVQRAMFKQMTKSLSIPHFGYADSLDLSKTSVFRSTINKSLESRPDAPIPRISHLAIHIKALSLALLDFPIMNARLNDTNDMLVYRSKHNIGVAIDSPSGHVSIIIIYI